MYSWGVELRTNQVLLTRKLSDLETKFLGVLEKRYPYLVEMICELTKPGLNPYEGTKYRPDFVLYLPLCSRYRGVVVEIQGGIFQGSKTGHSTGQRLVRDYDKCVVAQLNGYFFLPVAPTKDAILRACDLLDRLYSENQELI